MVHHRLLVRYVDAAKKCLCVTALLLSFFFFIDLTKEEQGFFECIERSSNVVFLVPEERGIGDIVKACSDISFIATRLWINECGGSSSVERILTLDNGTCIVFRGYCKKRCIFSIPYKDKSSVSAFFNDATVIAFLVNESRSYVEMENCCVKLHLKKLEDVEKLERRLLGYEKEG